MIIARIEGGLGNQLFIYACARALALRNNRELVLDIQNAGYDGSDPFQRRYQLGHFPIQARLAGAEELRHFRRDGRFFYWLKKVSRWLPQGWKPILEERSGFALTSFTKEILNPIYLVGYWQDERYFLDRADQIAAELSPSQLNQLVSADECRLIEMENTLVIHIRRENFPSKLSLDYYAEAVQRLGIDRQKTQFVVFGDSFDWANETLGLPTNTIFMSRERNKSELADFYLMAHAKQLIVSNSTFSWWAAWFASRRGAKVVAPENWGYPATPSASWSLVPENRYQFD